MLTAVGDLKQQIMGWAGALDGIFGDLVSDYGAEPLYLYQNFRSAPRIRRMHNAMVRVMDPEAAITDADLAGDDGDVLVEHYAGAFPVWLSPVQVVGVPVAEEFNDYLWDVLSQMKAQGIRVELDESDDRFPKKIRNASKSKVPYVLIAGEEDRSAGAVSFRYRDGSQKNGVPIADAIAEITAAIADRRQV